MATIRELSEQLVLGHAKPLLRSHGYRKNRWVWSKTDGDLTRLFWVMFSKHNSRSECRFTVNLDICSQEVRAATGQEPATKWLPGSGKPGHVSVVDAVGGPRFWSVTPAEGVTAEHHESFEITIGNAVDRLEGYGYLRESGVGPLGQFVDTAFGIAVAVREREIAFNAPYGDAIFEALMTASELTDGDALALFDPQTGEWND